MEQQDWIRFFDLMDALFDGARHVLTDKKALALRLALEGYGYDELKAALLACARASRFCPSVSEIVRHLPAGAREEAAQSANADWMAPYLPPPRTQSVSYQARQRGVPWQEMRRMLPKNQQEESP